MQCTPTEVLKAGDQLMSAEDVITKVGTDFKLNEKQWIAFRIIARSFVQGHVNNQELGDE